jgi:FeS assembly protein SufB
MTQVDRTQLEGLGRYAFGWSDSDAAGAAATRGLSETKVREISALKNEPEWMLNFRLKGLRLFDKKPMPNWGADLSGIDFDNIKYFVRSTEKQATSWDELPADIKNTYDKLGIPEAEKQRLIAGVAAQYECLSADTRVWTANRGQIAIKEIEPGDLVFSYDEDAECLQVSRVKAAAQTDVRQTFEVKVGTRTIRATDNHPFLVRTSAGAEWRTLGDLRPGDLVAVPTGLPEFGGSTRLAPDGSTLGPVWTTPEVLWLLGLFLRAGGTRVVSADADVRAEVTRLVNVIFGVRVTTPADGELAVECPTLGEWLETIGFAADAHAALPQWVFTLSRAERVAFLRGWLGAGRVTSSNRQLLDQGRELAQLSGLEVAGPFEVGHGHALALLSTVPATQTTLDFVGVDTIEPYEVEPVYDVEVDGPHNFIAEGLIVHNSEVVYHQIREDLEQQGVLFLDTDSGLKQHEDLFREYFGSVIPAGDNKFSALNSAVWSGGSFIYVPPGVHVDIPLQAYFRINTENMGQFERTLIIADEDSYVHYVEGCTAPIYSSDSLHSAVVEIIVKKNARVRYTTIQNWSNNVYNLVTKRALAHEGATMEWIDGNLGSKVTMKYPAVWMVGEHAKGETLSVAFAGEGQHQDAGAKMVHAAPHTSSTIISKSVARGGGRTSYRGLVQVQPGSHHSKSTVKCDALLVDTISRSDTYPYVDVREDDVQMGHEATVSKVSEDQLFYLMSRGLSEDEAMAMIVRGFVEPIARELPMEYALELNRLIELQMEGAVG